MPNKLTSKTVFLFFCISLFLAACGKSRSKAASNSAAVTNPVTAQENCIEPCNASLNAVDTTNATTGNTKLDFGKVPLNQKIVKAVQINNLGQKDASSIQYAISDNSFQLDKLTDASTCKSSLAAGASCVVYIAFSPTAPGQVNSKLTLSFHDGSKTKNFDFALQGEGVMQNIATLSILSGQPIFDFGSVVSGARKKVAFPIMNVGTADVTHLFFSLPADSNFKFESDPTMVQCDQIGGLLRVGQTCMLTLSFGGTIAPTSLEKIVQSRDLSILFDNGIGQDGKILILKGEVSVPAPTVNIQTSNARSLAYNSSVKISWTSTNAASCVLSSNRGLAASVNVVGSYDANYLKAETDFTVTCQGPGGSNSASIAFSVTPLSINTGSLATYYYNSNYVDADTSQVLVGGGCAPLDWRYWTLRKSTTSIPIHQSSYAVRSEECSTNEVMVGRSAGWSNSFCSPLQPGLELYGHYSKQISWWLAVEATCNSGDVLVGTRWTGTSNPSINNFTLYCAKIR